MRHHATPPPARDHVNEFVEQVLRTGLMLTDLLAGLLEDLPPDAFPGEDAGEVLLAMVTGSVRPAVEAAGAPIVVQATALVAAVGDRTLADLREAHRRAAER